MTRAWVGSGEDDVGEDGQGQLAVPEHVVVEAPDVEGGTLPALTLSAQALDLAPAGHVGERLARPRPPDGRRGAPGRPASRSAQPRSERGPPRPRRAPRRAPSPPRRRSPGVRS